jgi:hypothetical protein
MDGSAVRLRTLCPTLTTIQIKDVVPDRAAFFFW